MNINFILRRKIKKYLCMLNIFLFDFQRFLIFYLHIATAEQNTINTALTRIQDQTRVGTRSCITFQPRTNQANYVRIIKGSGCYSYVGKISTTQPQDLSLGNGCVYVGIIMHEFAHALGQLIFIYIHINLINEIIISQKTDSNQ